MDGWLPEGYENDGWEERAGKALRAVKAREARRRKRVRLAGALAAGTLFVALLFLPGLFRRGASVPPSLEVARPVAAPAPGPASPPPAAPAPVPPAEEARRAAPAAPRPPAEVTPRLQKAGGAVLVTWSGDPEGKYVVYKCESPAFNACTRKAEVQGTSWADGEMDSSPLVFYKVERKA